MGADFMQIADAGEGEATVGPISAQVIVYDLNFTGRANNAQGVPEEEFKPQLWRLGSITNCAS
ncbi:hypothetical protein GCM10025791_00930 [Halioxenophilus aromaticivorans]|uniref:Uncharacterized protein n=1 Tax=Halioxenophilus aromaticivorans TaxID=1306992 RepID=A0AAV3TWU3_9ALTE